MGMSSENAAQTHKHLRIVNCLFPEQYIQGGTNDFDKQKKAVREVTGDTVEVENDL